MELIGGTPLVEVVNIEKELGLEAAVLVKLEYFVENILPPGYNEQKKQGENTMISTKARYALRVMIDLASGDSSVRRAGGRKRRLWGLRSVR